MTVNRKVNYCLTSSIDNPNFGPIYDILSSGTSTLTLGLTNDAVTENLPILFGVEIKKTNGDIDDAEVQLKIFFHAFFKRLEYIETYLERKVDMAVMGVVVHGHIWIPYVACRDGTELHVERLAHAICHTESFLGVFTTISLMDRI